MKRLTTIILLITLTVNINIAQTEPHGGEAPHIAKAKSNECLSEERRNTILAHIKLNRERLTKEGILKTDSREITLFQWPIKNSEDNDEYSSYGISNYVDHNSSFPDQLSDYQCGTKTYDTASGYNHAGIDIYLWPFEWYKMENNHVSAIAAAEGVIIFKEDGNYDKSCGFNNNPWNAIYIGHTDGSFAFYGHLKSNGLTEKSIGQSVSQGEFLGYIGSSGNSTGPHLHFEVYDSNENLIDPYQGSCNNLNSESWWQNQKSYLEPQINTMYVHSAPPDFKACPQTEEVNIVNQLEYNTSYNFATYYHDQQINDLTSYRILRPNGSVFSQWSHNSPNSYYSSYWYWTYSFNPLQPAGEWTFEATYEGETYVRNFFLEQDPTSTNNAYLNQVTAYPNPFNESVTLTNCKNMDVTVSTISGKTIYVRSNSQGEDIILDFSELPSGIYITTLKHDKEVKSIKLYHHQ
ncbi:MAG: murein DD-endopeptidase MepM/ murein hydrolase activator NlpD [Saprospiraceae bacterium]|jgi:murein DD-endopeptidase MepM/ murein hydrolase activator NlpD